METTATKVKFTARVRRGLAMVSGDGFARAVERRIAARNHVGTPRRQWYTAGQQADLRTMAAWLDQQIGAEVQP